MLAKKAATSDRGATQEILITLLDSHAGPKAKNQNREKFLHAITFYGRSELYPTLMGRFPRLPQNSRDLHGLTPLHKAVLGKSVAMMNLLCSGGAKIESEDDNEMTPLHTLEQNGLHLGVLILRFLPGNLETNEEFVSAKDKDGGRTAYDYANDRQFDKLARHIYAFPP